MPVVGAIVALVPLPYANIPFDLEVAWLSIAPTRRGASSYSRRNLRRRAGVRLAAHEVAVALSVRAPYGWGPEVRSEEGSSD